jgi:integrase
MAGQVIAKGENRWLLRFYNGRNPITRKRNYVAKMFSGTSDAAKAQLEQMISAHKLDGNLKTTVNEFFEQWFATFAENRYWPRTVKNYKQLYSANIRPIIGDVRLCDLQPCQIQTIFRSMAQRGLSSNTRRKHYSLLSIALDCAVASRLLKKNPISEIEIPRRIVKEMRAMSRQEVSRLLAVTDSGEHPEFFRTALVTGMRPGELFGLRWSDVDFEARTITIQRSLVWLDGIWHFMPPKTERSRRQIAIPDSLTRLLGELNKRQNAKAFCAQAEHDFVFKTESEKPWCAKKFAKRVLKPALKLAGLPREIRLQDLRHTNATLLIKDGENIKVVSQRLGHSNINITLEIYVHVLPGTQSDAAARISAILGDPKHTE